MDSVQSLDDPNVRSLIDILGDPIQGTTGELRFQSPFQSRFNDPLSEDTKKHLYVNVKKGMFICFKSGVSGSLSYLFNVLGADLEKVLPVYTGWADLKDRFRNLDKLPEPFQIPKAEMPEWAQDVQAGSEVHRYLRGRGVQDTDIGFYGIQEGTGEYSGWLVVPNVDKDGTCEYWVSRNTRKKAYLNPTVDRRYHVGFLDNALAYSPGHVVVCEGVFSAIAAGRDAVASYGKFVTNAQLQRMWDAGVRKVTLALDGDAWEETVDTATRGLRIGMSVRVVPMPSNQDPDDLGRETFRLLVDECSLDVTELSLTKLRLLSVAV
jgi:hypothetical protein